MRAGVVWIVLLAGLLAAATVEAQAPQPSLVAEATPYYITVDGLSNQTADAANCVAVAPPEDSNEQTFSIDRHDLVPPIHTEPGRFYPVGDSVTVNLVLVSGSQPDQAAQSGSGITITGTLSWGGNASVTADPPVSVGPAQQPGSASLTFPLTNVTADTGPLSLTIEIAAAPAAMGLPAAADVAVQCGVEGSRINGLQLARGMIGEMDLDADGIPDSEDDDRDGDGVDNAEENVACTYGETTVNFANNGELQPGPNNDADGDGISSQEECAAGYNPLDAFSTPPQPAGFPWVLVILLVVVLALIAAIVFVVLKFGRVADLAVVSKDQLIVDAGKVAKYEVAVESRKTSGDAVTLQIGVEGMPEGWDARTDVDHVAVEPQGSDGARKTFFLTVETPDHEDPESAVVAIKAIPLNKQGRKDTFKMAARAQTITSINVPPDAKVPVKRGGPIKLKEGEEPEETMGIPPEGLPLTDLPGLGDAKAKKLEAAGVATTEALRTADLTDLARKTKIDAEELGRFQKMSDLVRIPGISPEEAKTLVDGGVGSPKDLSEKSPEDIEALFPKATAEPMIEFEETGA